MASVSQSTQDFVPIKEIRDGIVVLKDGSLRSVIMASSVNFALKSDDERTSILLQFQNFLNALEQRKKEQVNDLMKIQTQEYVEFIKKFTDSTNIMTKNFFVIVPYSAAILRKGGKFSTLLKRKESGDQAVETANLSFEENRTQLEQRMAIVEQGLVRSGIRIARLGTEEVTELFYKLFNPGETEKPVQMN